MSRTKLTGSSAFKFDVEAISAVITQIDRNDENLKLKNDRATLRFRLGPKGWLRQKRSELEAFNCTVKPRSIEADCDFAAVRRMQAMSARVKLYAEPVCRHSAKARYSHVATDKMQILRRAAQGANSQGCWLLTGWIVRRIGIATLCRWLGLKIHHQTIDCVVFLATD